jgi:folate-binding protein YgfZ
VIVDLSDWGHIRVSGPDHLRFLQGLTTANVDALAAGGVGEDAGPAGHSTPTAATAARAHTWGAILNPKGRVLSVIRVARGADDVLLHCEPSLTDATRALLDKYAVMDDVTFEALPGPAYTVWTSAAQAWDAPVVMAAPPEAPAPADAVEALRVEAGILRYGVDVGDDAFPFETPLVRYLDYQKGCYIGQEPVFRVHARGQAARALRGLRIEGDGPVAPGTRVVHPARPDAGQVTSAAVSPRLGAIAMAYVHRSAWDLGGEVTVDGRRAVLVDLPMG